MKRVRGVTLIELMIVVAIVAILAAVAITAYNKQMRKSRRAEAKQALSDISLKQEKWRTSHGTFGSCNQVSGPDPTLSTNCASYNSSLTYYTIAVTVNNATQYTMTAAPKGDQTKDVCGTLTFANDAGTISKTSSTGSDCW